jgi:hypothetical protein
MMKTVAALALVSIFVGTQAAPKTPTIAGQWTLEAADGPHGAMTMALKCEQKGSDVAAALNIPHIGDIPMQGEFVKGKLSLRAGTGAEAMTLSATLKDDGTLAGFISSERGDMKWTGKRTAK